MLRSTSHKATTLTPVILRQSRMSALPFPPILTVEPMPMTPMRIWSLAPRARANQGAPPASTAGMAAMVVFRKLLRENGSIAERWTDMVMQDTTLGTLRRAAEPRNYEEKA